MQTDSRAGWSSRLVSTFRRWFRRFRISEILSCDGTNLVSEEIPLQDTDASPAQLLMERQLRDSVPTTIEHYCVSRQWARMLRHHGQAVVHTGDAMSARFNQAAHELIPITPGQQVCRFTRSKPTLAAHLL